MAGNAGGPERFVVTVDADALTASLALPARDHAGPIPEIEVRAALEAQGIAPSLVDGDALRDLLALHESEPGVDHKSVIARGTPPVHGDHAAFDLSPDLRDRLDETRHRAEAIRTLTSVRLPPSNSPDDATVDHRATSAFVIVRRGAVLGVVREASSGSDGVDVRGGTIPARRGHTLPMKFDASVRVCNGEAIAACDGRLVAKIDRLAVERTLEVDGDVDYHTGNIDFPGPVVVHGGVKDHFVVRSTASISIGKLVEGAIINAMGDVTLTQGMAARDLGRVAIAGNLTAGYLDGVIGEVAGDLRAAHEIKACHLAVGRALIAPSAALFGGLIETKKPAEIGVLGAPGGVETELTIGKVQELEAIARRALNLRQILKNERDRAASELHALNHQIARLTATQAERLTELQFTSTRADEHEARLDEATARLLDAAEAWAVPRLVVQRAVYKGARVTLRAAVLTFKDMVQGPLTIELDPAGEPVCWIRGAAEPVPAHTIAIVRRLDTDDDPIQMLRSGTPRAHRDAA